MIPDFIIPDPRPPAKPPQSPAHPHKAPGIMTLRPGLRWQAMIEYLQRLMPTKPSAVKRLRRLTMHPGIDLRWYGILPANENAEELYYVARSGREALKQYREGKFPKIDRHLMYMEYGVPVPWLSKEIPLQQTGAK